VGYDVDDLRDFVVGEVDRHRKADDPAPDVFGDCARAEPRKSFIISSTSRYERPYPDTNRTIASILRGHGDLIENKT
jgi:hypothetical protein